MSRQRNGHASDPKVQGKLRDMEKERRLWVEHAWKAVLATPEGKTFFISVIYGPCELEGGTLPTTNEAAHFDRGRRSVAHRLIGEADRLAPGALSTAIAEEFARRAQDELLRVAAMTKTAEETVDEEQHAD